MDAGVELTPLPGGWSGETFLAEAGGERTVVRIYARPGDRGGRPGDAAHEIDASLLRLVRGLVPVPEVLEVRRADPAAGMPALLVTSYVEGVRGDEVVPTLGGQGLAVLGRNLGELAADLAGMPMLRPGPFVDGELRIGSFGDVDGLPAFLEQVAPPGLDADRTAALEEVVVDAQALLDTVGRTSLVHSDLNPKNVVVDPESLDVRALLDWEYSHAGHPYTDLGNLLRFEREPTWERAVLSAWTDRHGGSAREALDLARAADLWALIDLAARAGENPVADRALALLRGIADDRDVHAGWTG
ncbi:phosphotransferase family protein [Nocardioides sp. GCM10027113]|uniref:phosphotransferase family protein n=1 Tax=unclassified Nocardioides TaxID=2615069 RepID=UPI00361CD3C0